MIGSLGVPEILFILVLALLVFGPKRLPEIGRTVGKGLAEFRKASNELKRTINAELALDEAEVPRPRQARPAALWPEAPEPEARLPVEVEVAEAEQAPEPSRPVEATAEPVPTEPLDPK